MKIVDYLKKLINDYYLTDNILEKRRIAKFIYTFYNSINVYDFHDTKVYREFKKLYRNFMASINYKKENDSEKEECKKYVDNANEDLLFLKELLKYIKVKVKKTIRTDNIGTLEQFYEYIKSNKNFYNIYKNIKYELVLDENIISGVTLKSKDKYSFILENLNISLLLHELMHIYNKFSFSKYYETPSIIAEMAITNRFNIDDDLSRIDDIKSLKPLVKRGIKDLEDYYNFCYGIASLIAVSFVNQYGNNFNDVIKVSDYVIKNEYVSLSKLFEFLNINESEIIDSVNNIEKILTYKKSKLK